jgi:hypothetical protein
MPGDRFAFAVGVGREIEPLGAAHRLGHRLDVLLGFAVDLPRHREIVVGQHRAVLGRQVADMAIARHDLVVGPRYLLMVFALAGDSTMTTFMHPIGARIMLRPFQRRETRLPG